MNQKDPLEALVTLPKSRTDEGVFSQVVIGASNSTSFWHEQDYLFKQQGASDTELLHV